MSVRTRDILKLLITFLAACLVTFLLYFTVPQVMALIDTAGSVRLLFVQRLVLSILIMSLFFAWLSSKKFPVRFIMAFLVFLPTIAACYIGIKYELIVSTGFFADVMATNAKEASSSALSIQVFLSLAAYGLFIFLLSFALGKLRIESSLFGSRKSRIAANAVFVILLLCSFHVHFYPLRVYYDCVRNLYIARTETYFFIKNMTYLENRDDPCTQTKPLPKSGILFMHIGESVRADHAPMNGYSRNTMPRMMREQNKGNLFSFPVAISFATGTRFSVAGMLTSASIPDPEIKSSSFISVLAKMGVRSAAMFSSIGGSSVTNEHDVGMNIFTSHVSKRIHNPGLAHSLLPDIKQIVSSDPNETKFIIYQGEGSHFPYNNYDETKFSVFTPVNFLRNADYTTTNAYDNTIVCLDDFIGQSIDSMKDKNAVYIYASDHGELMGDNGKWGRNGMDDIHMRNILFFIWVSDSFKKNNPDKFAALKENRQRLEAVSHDYIYHTVLGFYNIRNRDYDSTLDLFSADARAFAGPMPSSLPKDSSFRKLKFSIGSERKKEPSPI